MSNPIGSRDYDHVVLAGQRSPGIARVKGAGSPRRIRERTGYGLSGATARFAGVMNSHFTVEIDLLEAEHWEAWTAWLPLVQRPPLGERARALDIEHPFLEDLGIRSILVEDVSQPEPIDDKGGFRVTIAVIEYRRPTPALSSPSGSAQNVETADERELRVALGEFDAASEAAGLAGPPGAL